MLENNESEKGGKRSKEQSRQSRWYREPYEIALNMFTCYMINNQIIQPKIVMN